MAKIGLSTFIVLLFLGTSKVTSAEVRSYALIVGNNLPYNNAKLDTLKFADDDAVRYYRFFRRLTTDAVLLTVPDLRTQKRYAGIGDAADPPTLSNLNRAVDGIARRIAADKKAGHKTVLYFAFSGHGDHAANGEVFLSLLDAGLTGQTLYQNVVEKIHADYQHLFIDACYAEGVVGFRGAFDKETDGTPVRLSEAEVAESLGKAAQNFPGLGIVVSSSSETTSHEWSKIESGVFTHEVLSALSGAADVNLDGRIEYSELAAFISSANLEVADTRGRIEVVAVPPNRNRSVPIVELSQLKGVAFLSGDPSGLGHFSIELENGEKYLDANLSGMRNTNIALPTDIGAYLYTQSQEAALRSGRGGRIELAMLTMTEKRISERGGVEDALRQGLFTTPYGKSFYAGYADSKGYICVPFDSNVFVVDNPKSTEGARPVSAELSRTDGSSVRKPLAIIAFAVGGTTAVLGGVFGALSLNARNEYEEAGPETFENELKQINSKYQAFGTSAWVMIGIAPVALITGAILWPKKSSHKKAALSLEPTGTGLRGTF